MKKHRSPVKAARQDKKRHERNVSYKSAVATASKRVLAAVTAGDKAMAAQELKAAQALIDSGVTKGILHANTASRRVSRIGAHVAKLGK